MQCLQCKGMAESKVVSIRVPQELLNAVDQLAAVRYPSRRGKEPNRSQLILDALESYVAHFDDTVSKCHTGEVEALVMEKLAPIQKKLAALESALGESKL